MPSDAEPTVARGIGYLAGLIRSRDAAVLDFVRSRSETAEGLVRALSEEQVSPWNIARLLAACGSEALREAGANEQTLDAVTAWEEAAARPAPVETVTEPERPPDLRVLTDLLRIGADLDVSHVGERLIDVDESDVDEQSLREAGEALLAAQGGDTLAMLSDKSERWQAALRRHRAAAGALDAQLGELADLAEDLPLGEPSALRWLTAIRDPEALPALESLLVAAGSAQTPEAYPDITAPVLNAIAAVADAAAIELLDRIARERRYPGAQFLVDDRDRLIQSLLEEPARTAAHQRAGALQLPADEL